MTNKRHLKNNFTAYLFLIPWFIGFICFTLFPVLFMFGVSLTNRKLNGISEFVGLQNYKIFMPPLCGIFFLLGGGRTGCNTFDCAAQEQGQVGCGLPEKPHGLCAES